MIIKSQIGPTFRKAINAFPVYKEVQFPLTFIFKSYQEVRNQDEGRKILKLKLYLSN